MSRRDPPSGPEAGPGAGQGAGQGGRLRLDRWLWHVRAFRTRPLAAEAIAAGGVRVNGQPCRKPGRAVGPGDIVTFPAGRRVLVYQMVAPGTRRGPAAEAATLYRDLTPVSGVGDAAP